MICGQDRLAHPPRESRRRKNPSKQNPKRRLKKRKNHLHKVSRSACFLVLVVQRVRLRIYNHNILLAFLSDRLMQLMYRHLEPEDAVQVNFDGDSDSASDVEDMGAKKSEKRRQKEADSRKKRKRSKKKRRKKKKKSRKKRKRVFLQYPVLLIPLERL